MGRGGRSETRPGVKLLPKSQVKKQVMSMSRWLQVSPEQRSRSLSLQGPSGGVKHNKKGPRNNSCHHVKGAIPAQESKLDKIERIVEKLKVEGDGMSGSVASRDGLPGQNENYGQDDPPLGGR